MIILLNSLSIEKCERVQHLLTAYKIWKTLENYREDTRQYELVDIKNKNLKAFPLKDYGSRVASVEEADEDLGKMYMDELIRKLLTHEMTLRKEEEQEKEKETRRKPLALKSSIKIQECESSSGSESRKDEDKKRAMLSRKVKKIMRNRRKEKRPFKCGKQGHIKANCFKSKNKKFEKKKKKRKASKSIWDDTSSSEDEDEEVANL
ncbi:general transcription factor IIF subunit 1-like [Ricinus communis]|uniref:general transcription factor IIF subunit 1-like n=1 Tax=Ricinus communis TaxID=3988 RepID=UPI00201AC9D8|nr:general transcription factor IIF subunit 1-like [Ricinus communis]